MTWEDPIVAEVHRIREQLAADCSFDIAVFFAKVRQRQAALGNKLVHEERTADSTSEIAASAPVTKSA